MYFPPEKKKILTDQLFLIWPVRNQKMRLSQVKLQKLITKGFPFEGIFFFFCFNMFNLYDPTVMQDESMTLKEIVFKL